MSQILNPDKTTVSKLLSVMLAECVANQCRFESTTIQIRSPSGETHTVRLLIELEQEE